MYGFSTTQAEGTEVEQTETGRCRELNAVNLQRISEKGAVMGIPLEGPSYSDDASFVYVSQEKAEIAHKPYSKPRSGQDGKFNSSCSFPAANDVESTDDHPATTNNVIAYNTGG